MTTDDLLKQGIAALNAGRKMEARGLLTQVVEQDEHNETAWLWLSGAVDTDEERRTCLENVLAINPNNGVAKRGLESLIAKEGVRPLKSVSPPMPRAEPAATPREQPAQPLAKASAPDITQRKKRKAPPKRKKVTKQQTRLLIALAAGVSVFACVALAGVWWAVDTGLLQLGPAARAAVRVLAPTLTEEEIYAQEMEPVQQKLQAWIDGPVAEWNTALTFQMEAPDMISAFTGESNVTLGELLDLTLLMMAEIGYFDLSLDAGHPLIALPSAIADQGFEVLSEMESVTPPAQIRTAHNKVTNCVRYEIDRSNAILSALTTGTFDDPGPDQCKQLQLASAQVLEFIEEHR